MNMNVFDDIKTGLEQAIEYEKKSDNYMTTDEIAIALVKLYADYKSYSGFDNEDYAEAVGIAIRMLTD